MEPITAENVDLTSCDRELIQFPQAIQPHGVLLTVDEASGHILHASANCAAALGVGPEQVLGKLAASVLGRSERDWLGAHKGAALDSGPVHLARESFVDSDRGYHLFAHRSGGLIVLEMEIARAADEAPARLYSDLRADIAKLQATKSLGDFFALAVQRIRDFTGYDRVMAYRFDDDGSGEVVAESKRDDLEGYLGLHYPASDIPAPARRLFSLAWVRHLPDVDYVPVPLVAAAHSVIAGPVDMSYAALRSVSVMYTAYLRNMGVRSSMVMPLMKEGRLWGLISAMHHSGPRHVPHETRMAAEFLAHTLSLMMSAKEDADIFERVLATGAATDKLIQAVSQGREDVLAQMRTLIECGGAARVARDRIARIGRTPAEPELRDLAQWLDGRDGAPFATDRLATLYPPAEAYADVASGGLAARIGGEWLIWLRPEQIADVNWAGDPHKPVDVVETEGALRLRPRGSFALWKESVRHRSTPWRDYEKDAVLKLAKSLRERQPAATPAPRLADEFAEAASRELKAQVRGLQHLAVQLSRRQGDVWDEEGRGQVAAILKLTQRMDGLADALMSHARIGRGLDVETVDLDAVVDGALRAARLDPSVEVSRPTRLGAAVCHRESVAEVFASLIDNAARYNDKPARRIEIGVRPGEPPCYYVGDNGVGVAADDRDLIFQAFRRLSDQGGAGVGLAFARRIVERHGGRLWVESTPGESATFVFTLAPEANAAA